MATASGQTSLPSRRRVYLLVDEAFHGTRSAADGLQPCGPAKNIARDDRAR